MRAFRVSMIALALSACAERRQPMAASPPPVAAAQIGTATWYGERHHGRRTASGEIFNHRAMTAAHRTLRMGTRVRVTNLATGRSGEVRITDRCACTTSVIDLSKAAAQAIGIPTGGGGTGRVRIEEL